MTWDYLPAGPVCPCRHRGHLGPAREAGRPAARGSLSDRDRLRASLTPRRPPCHAGRVTETVTETVTEISQGHGDGSVMAVPTATVYRRL